jgi:hypothetical protein
MSVVGPVIANLSTSTTMSCRSQRLSGDFGNGLIQRWAADEDTGRATARLLVVTVFGHRQLPHLCGVVADALWVGNRARMGHAGTTPIAGEFASTEDRVCGRFDLYFRS